MFDSPGGPPITPAVVEVAEGHRLAVRERDPGGTGRAVLLVHGLASNARLWDGVSAVLAGCGHRVVAVDQRGHGRSDRAASGYGYPALAADLVSLCERMDLDEPVLAGQSWGGNVAVHTAALHPDRWHGVAAVDGGTIRLRTAFEDPVAAWAALQPPPLTGRRAEEIRTRLAGAGWSPNGVEAIMGNFEERPDGTVAPRLSREDHRAIVEAMWAEDPVDAFPKVRVPVLLLPVRGDAAWAGGKDTAVAEALEALPDGRVRWFEGVHDVHLQDPTGVAEALLTLV